MRWNLRALRWTHKQGPNTGTAKLTRNEFRPVCAFLTAHLVAWILAWVSLLVWFWDSPAIWIGGIPLAFFIPSGRLSYRRYCADWERDNTQKTEASQVER